jgi:hypothetical protein
MLQYKLSEKNSNFIHLIIYFLFKTEIFNFKELLNNLNKYSL